MDSSISASKDLKDRERDKEKDKDKEKEKEREREADMEAALYTNCLLLGLDASILGPGGMPRSGLFRHSNPRMGEALLHFLLSALRGPTQSAKDFAGVWPIFDAAQSRDFRKIVQNLINELEAQGALPRSNSRVSSLATCCGQRFVELLWQLSAHALREVHKRSFPADVSTNPLPAPLTEVVAQNTHAAALLTVTKARIAIERRRFLDGAATAVRRQALWASLAHDMTAEYRALCAEEAYLHQELEKLQDLKNLKESSFREGQTGSGSFTEDQKSVSVSRASHLWESLISHTARHKKLASGPIEDLIAHREHRYRVSGPALRAAIDRSSSASTEASAFVADEPHSFLKVEEDNCQPHSNGYVNDMSKERPDTIVPSIEANDDIRVKNEDRAGKGSAPLDVAEILRRWTHSLQRIHKQALRLARSNDGAGPELMRDSSDHGDNGHAQALRATLAEHKQHLANIQVLIGQLKEFMPGMEASIASLREQVSRTTPLMVPASSSSPLSDRLISLKEASTGQIGEAAVKTAPSHLELVPPSPALKLPQLFSLFPVPVGKSSNIQRHRASVPRMRSLETPQETDSSAGQTSSANTIKEDIGGSGKIRNSGNKEYDLASLRQAVHDAALSTNSIPVEETTSERSAHDSEHFFTPILSTNLFSKNGQEETASSGILNTKSVRTSQEYHRYNGTPIEEWNREAQSHVQTEGVAQKQVRGSKPASKSLNYSGPPRNGTSLSGPDMERVEAGSETIGGDLARPFSPPLLTELSSFTDTYDDLLGIEDYELCDVALEGVWFNPGM